MQNPLRALLRPVVATLWWRVMNVVRDHRVQSSAVSLRAKIGFRSIVRKGVELGGDVSLGDFSYVSGPGTYVESARIGRFCSIARATVIGVSGKDINRVTTHDFITAAEYGRLTRELRFPDQKDPPIIGHDVWLGYGAIIMRGVTIGNGAVIGANSVVTRDVPPYAVVGGNPARHLRDRFPPEQVAALLRIGWWDWNPDKLSACAADFLDIARFIELHDPALQAAQAANTLESGVD